MDRLKQYTPMKTSVLLLLFGMTLFSGCDAIISSAESDGALPENPSDCSSGSTLCASNPNDPNSESFVLPELVLEQGFFNSPFTIEQNEFTFNWNVIDDNGNEVPFDYEYRFAWAAPGETISESDFVQIGPNQQSYTVSGLSDTFDDERYTFEIRATYTENNRDTSFTGEFYVNAFQQRGFLFSPSTITENNDGTYTASIYLDEIQATDDLTALSLTLNYNGNQITPIEEDIRVFDTEGDFLRPNGVDEVIWFTDIGTSSLTLDIGLAGNNIDPISGGGAICEIVFQPTSSFSGTSINISSNSVLKDSEGFDIEIENYHSATLID